MSPLKDKKFVAKILGQLRTGIRELAIVNDRFGSPAYADKVVSNGELLLSRSALGTFHMTGHGRASRLSVALEALDRLGLHETMTVRAVASRASEQIYFAARLGSEQRVNANLRKHGLDRMRHWQEILACYLAQYDWLGPTWPTVAWSREELQHV